MKPKKIIAYFRNKFILPLFFMLWILYFSAIKSVQVGVAGRQAVINTGVIAHSLAYLVLSCSFFFYIYSKKESVPKTLLVSAIAAGAYGMFIEIVQYFIPYRHFAVQDIITNFAGALLIFPLFYTLPKKLKSWLLKD